MRRELFTSYESNRRRNRERKLASMPPFTLALVVDVKVEDVVAGAESDSCAKLRSPTWDMFEPP